MSAKSKLNALTYQRTGVGKCVAHVIFFTYLVGFPLLSQTYYPQLKLKTEEWGWSDSYLWGVLGFANTILAQVLMGIIFTVLYII